MIEAGKLELDMFAKLARLRRDMARARKNVRKAARKITRIKEKK